MQLRFFIVDNLACWIVLALFVQLPAHVQCQLTHAELSSNQATLDQMVLDQALVCALQTDGTLASFTEVASKEVVDWFMKFSSDGLSTLAATLTSTPALQIDLVPANSGIRLSPGYTTGYTQQTS